MKNVDNLAEVLSMANSLSTKEYIAMSHAAVKFAEEQFNIERYNDKLVDFYRYIIQKTENKDT